MSDGRVAINAYIGAPMGVPDQTVGKLFTPIEVSTLYFEPERVGCEFCCGIIVALLFSSSSCHVKGDMGHRKPNNSVCSARRRRLMVSFSLIIFAFAVQALVKTLEAGVNSSEIETDMEVRLSALCTALRRA